MGTSQSKLNDPSDPWYNNSSRSQNTEYHSLSTCQYTKKKWYIHGGIANNITHWCGQSQEVSVLIRRCDCGSYTDAKHLLYRRKDLRPKGFGESIEMHIYDACEYSRKKLPNGTMRLEKHCYCARKQNILSP
ncbi:hypothetical protein ACJMK2_017436 [Sinanodonta woodiana]|uniref:Uncharacterized protein n=1 Tax=Sinanodonta woodiana TaxID=1069815 RepID=A0ABD3UA84_SINWO